jgi:hypothetical protein
MMKLRVRGVANAIAAGDQERAVKTQRAFTRTIRDRVLVWLEAREVIETVGNSSSQRGGTG